MSEATREELVALARFCGWRDCTEEEMGFRYTEGQPWMKKGFVEVSTCELDGCFDPAYSRNDAALLEDAIEKAGKVEQYCEALVCILDRELRDDEKPEDLAWILLRVTPAQRTQAALVALGIREEKA